MKVICVCACVSAGVRVGGYMFISVEEIEVMENSRSTMRCDVPFVLPNDIEVIWRFAEEVCSAYGDPSRITTIHSTFAKHTC